MRQEQHQKEENEIFDVGKSDQYRTVNELFSKSTPNKDYYVLLVLSGIIISCGLLLNNSAIVIGGMLVTPVLTPVLAIGLALAVGELRGSLEPVKLIVKSVIGVIIISMVLALFFGVEESEVALGDTVRVAILYFFVAISTGVVASFAWAKKELSDVLPGTAIAVSVVPPIALVGIWLSQLDLIQARFFFSVLILNLFGIVLGATAVFSYLKFNRVEKRVEDIVDEIEEQQTKIKQEKSEKQKTDVRGRKETLPSSDNTNQNN